MVALLPDGHEVPSSITGSAVGFSLVENHSTVFKDWVILCPYILSCAVFGGWLCTLQITEQGRSSNCVCIPTCGPLRLRPPDIAMSGIKGEEERVLTYNPEV